MRSSFAKARAEGRSGPRVGTLAGMRGRTRMRSGSLTLAAGEGSSLDHPGPLAGLSRSSQEPKDDRAGQEGRIEHIEHAAHAGEDST